jgi:signal transduction histidine kinase
VTVVLADSRGTWTRSSSRPGSATVNAVKSCVAAKSRAIAVAGTRDAAGVALTVSDDGLGFAPEDAEMIFEKFQRLGDELKRATPGTGLGLYIVKRLVELSGGTVAARSDGLGCGATVTLRWRNAGSTS